MESVQTAQDSALHRALDAAWWAGYEAGYHVGKRKAEGSQKAEEIFKRLDINE